MFKYILLFFTLYCSAANAMHQQVYSGCQTNVELTKFDKKNIAGKREFNNWPLVGVLLPGSTYRINRATPIETNQRISNPLYWRNLFQSPVQANTQISASRTIYLFGIYPAVEVSLNFPAQIRRLNRGYINVIQTNEAEVSYRFTFQAQLFMTGVLGCISGLIIRRI